MIYVESRLKQKIIKIINVRITNDENSKTLMEDKNGEEKYIYKRDSISIKRDSDKRVNIFYINIYSSKQGLQAHSVMKNIILYILWLRPLLSSSSAKVIAYKKKKASAVQHW